MGVEFVNFLLPSAGGEAGLCYELLKKQNKYQK